MSQKTVWPILILVAVGAGIYFFNLQNPLFWDDDDWIKQNPFVHDFRHVKEIFTENILAGFGLNSNYYRPLLLLSFAFNWVLHGAEPFGYHLVSNLFHIGSAVLIFLLLTHVFNSHGRFRVAGGQKPEVRYPHAAFLAALFWLIHPLNVEAVAYISGRGDPMSAFFTLFALYLWITDTSSRLSIGLAAISMILAILSRETAVLFPALATVFYIAFLDSQHSSEIRIFASLKSAFVKTVPFWVVSGTYFLLRLTVLNFNNTLNFYSDANIYTENLSYRLFTFGHALVEYFKLIFVPLGLHMERDLPVHTSVFQWPVWLGAVIVAGIVYIGYRFHRSENEMLSDKSVGNEEWKMENSHFRIWFFCWSWFLIGLVPVSGIIPINALIYEHWLYLPLIGVAVLFGFYVDRDFEFLKSKKISIGYKLLAIGLVVYFSFLGILTVKRNIAWGNPIEFYEDTLRYNPDTVRVINNLANLYSSEGNLDKAAELYQQAIDSRNGKFFAQPYYNLGNIYKDKGDLDRAVELYKQAVGIDPSFPFAYQNLAVIYAGRSKLIQAAEMLEIVKQLRPVEPFVYYNLALIYNAQGNKELTLENIEKGIAFAKDPELTAAFTQLRNQLQ